MRTILAAVDQSHHAHGVISRAAELAVLLRNDLIVLSVVSSDPMKQFNIVQEQGSSRGFCRETLSTRYANAPRKSMLTSSSLAVGDWATSEASSSAASP